MTATRTEISLVVRLLENADEWEDVVDQKTGRVKMTAVEAFAKNLIEELDKARASKTRYIAVAQFGGGGGDKPGMSGPKWFTGIGPYAGERSATKAAQSHPGFSLATGIVIVPVTSKEGFEERLREAG